jgi:hypothetical protein
VAIQDVPAWLPTPHARSHHTPGACLAATRISLNAAARVRAVRGQTRALAIVEEVVVLDTPTGPMHTLVLKPASPGRYPAILFYSEIFQVTGPIRRSAAMLACHGCGPPPSPLERAHLPTPCICVPSPPPVLAGGV